MDTNLWLSNRLMANRHHSLLEDELNLCVSTMICDPFRGKTSKKTIKKNKEWISTNIAMLHWFDTDRNYSSSWLTLFDSFSLTNGLNSVHTYWIGMFYQIKIHFDFYWFEKILSIPCWKWTADSPYALVSNAMASHLEWRWANVLTTLALGLWPATCPGHQNP